MLRRTAIVAIACVSMVYGARALAAQTVASAADPTSHDIRPGYGVTETRWLSDYLPALANTAGDTPIYLMRGDMEGGTLLLFGGTHGNEIAGVMAATLMVERGTVSQGTVIVIPHANNSAAQRNDGARHSGTPQWFELTTASGEARRFRYGSRLTAVGDQDPDPEVFVHPLGGEIAGSEARNLNRNHPGKANGTLTEQISYALFQLAAKESVDVVIDMHESSVTSRLAHMVVCHPRAMEVGAMAVLDLEMDGIALKQEVSQQEFRGLSHREFGDHTDALAFLVETPNPGQEDSIEEPDVVNDPEAPLSGRVHTHLRAVKAILDSYGFTVPADGKIEIGFPFSLDALKGSDLGTFLR
ncbi:MAG: succinylglutamate desuccinylase [Gemmatimonadetes bacterium]|nr:succinylglutamate desuccinylase [Gemmatimonadota bacterium]